MVDELNPDDVHESLSAIENPDRPRGILSRADREYLLGISDIEPKTQTERNTRARIRERVYHALLDFLLIDQHLPDRDRSQIVEAIDSHAEEGIHGLISFLYQAAEDEARFEQWLADGILHAEMGEKRDLVVRSPTVSLEIEPPQIVDPDEVNRKLEAGELEALTEAEMRFVLWWVGYQYEQLGMGVGKPFPALAEFASRIEDEGYLDAVRHPSEENDL